MHKFYIKTCVFLLFSFSCKFTEKTAHCLSASRDKLGLKTNPEDFKNLSASDLNKLAKDLGGVQLSANAGGSGKEGAGFGACGQIQYPADDPSISTGPAVQIYDPVTKSFSDYKGE